MWGVLAPCRSVVRRSVFCVPGGDRQLLLEPHDLSCGSSGDQASELLHLHQISA